MTAHPRAGILATGLLAILSAATHGQVIDPLVDGQAIVRLQPTADIGAFNARYQTTTLDELPSRKIYRLQLPAGADPDAFKQAASADPDVVWVELNYAGQVAESRGRCFYWAASPNADAFLAQPARAQLALPAAHGITQGAGITVAVVDTGIDATHVALLANVLPGGWNFIDQSADTSDVGNGLDDDGDGEIDEMVGHGTHVAGLVWMVAPDALLLPVKVVDSDGHSDNFLVAIGIFFAIDQAVDVINVSIGSTYNSQAVVDALLEAQAAGIPVAAAAGNMNVRTPVEYPALNAGAMGVAAVDASDMKSTFSNFHENLTVAAPGSEMVSTLPGNLFAYWNGTSMAAPLVSGTAALILSRHPEWPRDVSRANNVHLTLMQSADNIDPLNPDFAGLLGAGRIDAVAALAATSAFAAPVAYPAGPAPELVVVADFNADGLNDLAVADGATGAVAILLNVGSGMFAAPHTISLGSVPTGLASGDLDGDNDIDLVAASKDAHAVYILSNDGQGGFAVANQYGVSAGPQGVAVGQLVGDGALDIAVACESAGVVEVLRNMGNATFAAHAAPAVGSRPLDVVLSDVDGDGDLDLLAVCRDEDAVSVVRNNGDGTFAAAAQHAVGANPRALAAADWDADGALDIATANHDARNISILWGDGLGGFGGATSVQLDDQRKPERLTAADLDCDGAVDLIVTSQELTNTLSVLLGRGDRTFRRPVDYPVGLNAMGVVAADLDGDTDADLAVAERGAATVSVLLNRGCAALHRGDLNCDGAVTFDDIDPFVLALSDPASYGTSFPNCDWRFADCNSDGNVDFDDVNAFVALLSR
jgi:subtilisin family serine protease